jgi:adenosylcobinamide-GDP ribazoletransferase
MDQQDSPDTSPRVSDRATFAGDLAACIRFFSRLPLPRLGKWDDPAALPAFQRMARAAPLAGVLVALPAALVGLLLGFTALPHLAIGLLMTGALAAVTGGLHEDGLADVADGFFGGHTPERRLEIMKDSRIGSFGALTLIISALLRASLLAALITRFGPGEAILIFLGAEALSRALLVWQWTILPSARPDGLGTRFGQPGKTTAGQAVISGAICLIPAAYAVSVSALSLGLVLAILAALGTGRLAVAKIGGFTGDVLGALQQVTSLGFLIGILIMA